MRQLGLEPGVELVELGPVTPPPELAERLGLKAGDKALIRRRQMYAGGQPMQLATSYIPWFLAEGTQMVERDSGPGGICSRLADMGHRPVRSTEGGRHAHADPRRSPVPPAHAAGSWRGRPAANFAGR